MYMQISRPCRRCVIESGRAERVAGEVGIEDEGRKAAYTSACRLNWEGGHS